MTQFTTPIGRLVGGSLYVPQMREIKKGPDVGKKRSEYWIAVAIPKGSETHWNQTQWGAVIYAAGSAAFPNICNSSSFAWKVVDGDSNVPNKKGNAPSSNEGYKGHWVLNLSGGFAPKICTADGSAPITEEGAVKLGYYVQALIDVVGNGSTESPGVYLNHRAIALSGYGPEIAMTASVDTTAAGFGGVALPPGASTVPVAAYVAPATIAAPAPAVPVPLPVVPNPQFLAPPPPAAPVRVMLPAAQGASYEAMIAAGWTDALLRTHGMMS